MTENIFHILYNYSVIGNNSANIHSNLCQVFSLRSHIHRDIAYRSILIKPFGYTMKLNTFCQ